MEKKNPCGMVPFWFWNGIQDEKGISEQLKLAAEAGLRGMAIHARSGNRIEYLSPRWFELCRHACREAGKLGLEIWIYDEEGYPSGSVGGRLPAMGEPYRQQALAYSYTTAGKVPQELLALFAIDDLTTPVQPGSLAPETAVLAFWVEDSEPIPYIDTLNREAVKKFIEMTHERYYAELGEWFGNVIPVIYTDDLNHLLDDRVMHHLSWTGDLEEKFFRRFGYSLTEKLPLLLEDLPGCAAVRLHYRKLVRDLFVDNCVGQMTRWCREHQLELVGHLSGDEGPFSNILRQFTDPMPFYEKESVPGIDDFMAGQEDGRYLDRAVNQHGKSMLILGKTVSSAARQLGDGRCSGEILTSLGWGVPLARQLTQININLALGVNMLTPHAYSYTSGKLAKRDHPGSFFYQQPYFCFNREISQIVERSVSRLRQGNSDNDTLVIYPSGTFWIGSGADSLTGEKLQHFRNPDFPDPDEYYRYFAGLLLDLTVNHRQFDLGHEEQLARYGTVGNGELHLGAARYASVILPSLINLESSTLEILRRFAAAGGRVFYDGRLPFMLDGESFQDDLSFIRKLEIAPENLPFNAPEANRIMVQRRKVDGRTEYFVVNFSGSRQRLDLVEKNWSFYLPETGKSCGRSCELSHGEAAFLLPSEKFPDEAETPDLVPLEISWDIRRERGNLFLIDNAELPDGTNCFFGEFPAVAPGTVVRKKFDFPSGKAKLWSENKELLLNGRRLVFDGSTHPANNVLFGADLDGIIREGENTLEIITDGERPENIYLEGDFSVRIDDDRLTILPDAPPGFGNAALNGLPFYWGTVRYEGRFFAADAGVGRLEISGDGVMHCEVNSGSLPLVYTGNASREFRIQPGWNRVTVILANTAQNFFGHHREFALTVDYRGGEGRSLSSWRPPQQGEKPGSLALAPFGIRELIVKVEKSLSGV